MHLLFYGINFLTHFISRDLTCLFLTYNDNVTSAYLLHPLQSQNLSLLHSFIPALKYFFFIGVSLHRPLLPSGLTLWITGLFIGFSVLNGFLFISAFLPFSFPLVSFSYFHCHHFCCWTVSKIIELMLIVFHFSSVKSIFSFYVLD